MKTIGKDSAFTGVKYVQQKYSLKPKQEYTQGLTKREYFAAMIYQGMSTIPESLQGRKASAQMAVECADALIEALNKEQK